MRQGREGQWQISGLQHTLLFEGLVSIGFCIDDITCFCTSSRVRKKRRPIGQHSRSRRTIHESDSEVVVEHWRAAYIKKPGILLNDTICHMCTSSIEQAHMEIQINYSYKASPFAKTCTQFPCYRLCPLLQVQAHNFLPGSEGGGGLTATANCKLGNDMNAIPCLPLYPLACQSQKGGGGGGELRLQLQTAKLVITCLLGHAGSGILAEKGTHGQRKDQAEPRRHFYELVGPFITRFDCHACCLPGRVPRNPTRVLQGPVDSLSRLSRDSLERPICTWTRALCEVDDIDHGDRRRQHQYSSGPDDRLIVVVIHNDVLRSLAQAKRFL